MRNSLFRILSLISFLSGVFLLTNSYGNLSGAIIGVHSIFSTSGITGAFLILMSLVLFMISGNLENLISEEEFERRYEKIEPNLDKRVLILDTSLLLTYNSQEIKRLLKGRKVLVPNSVISEIRNPNLRRLIEDNSIEPKG